MAGTYTWFLMSECNDLIATDYSSYGQTAAARGGTFSIYIILRYRSDQILSSIDTYANRDAKSDLIFLFSILYYMLYIIILYRNRTSNLQSSQLLYEETHFWTSPTNSLSYCIYPLPSWEQSPLPVSCPWSILRFLYWIVENKRDESRAGVDTER